MHFSNHFFAIGGACIMLTAATVFGQGTADAPWLESIIDKPLDSGVRVNAAQRDAVVFSELVHVRNAVWLRLQFEEIALEGASRVRFTSLLDGEVQEMDADAVEMWGFATAYFNGDVVLVELIAAAGTQHNRLVLRSVATQLVDEGQPIGLCGICGSDDRVPSDEKWSGRLGPGVCSAAVINQNSCMVSAGHCMGATLVQFNVPNSFANCNIQNPPVADQFPIVEKVFNNGGVGADWAVFTTGTNNLGQTIYQRYGEFRPVSFNPAPIGGEVDVWGYGQSLTCTLNHVQQHSTGSITQRFSTHYRHNADTTGGNSGSGFLYNDQIVGVVTHCPCPNVAGRIDIPAFQSAILDLCPDPSPPNNTCQTTTLVGEGSHPFNNINATTNGPNEPDHCDFFGDTNIQSDVWFGHVAQCTGNLTISLCGSQYNTKLGVYGFSCPTEPGTIIACDVISCPDENRATVTIPVSEGEGFRIRVGGHAGAQGVGTLTISCEPAGPECPADLNGDGVVDVSDLLILLGDWGACPVGDCPADLNGDGVVDVSDLLILLGDWGSCP